MTRGYTIPNRFSVFANKMWRLHTQQNEKKPNPTNLWSWVAIQDQKHRTPRKWRTQAENVVEFYMNLICYVKCCKRSTKHERIFHACICCRCVQITKSTAVAAQEHKSYHFVCCITPYTRVCLSFFCCWQISPMYAHSRCGVAICSAVFNPIKSNLINIVLILSIFCHFIWFLAGVKC